MPIKTINNANDPFAIQLVTEDLIVSEVIEAQMTLYLSPGHDPATPVLWDSRTVDIRCSFTEILKMVDDSTGLWAKMSGGKSAILVGETKHAATARLYVQLAAAMPRELSVFTSFEAASKWLCEKSIQFPKAS
jgi:hypothetical protein